MSVQLRLTRGMPVVVQSLDLTPCIRWIDAMRRYGTNIVGCVSPNADQDRFGDLPLFRRCADALAAAGAEACVSLMPPRIAADSLLETAEAGVRLIIALSVGVPVHDMMRVHRRISGLGVTWIGAASSGIACPAAGVMLGAVPEASLTPGAVAVISASGSLAAEAGFQMREAGLGQSLYVDVGSDAVKGTRLAALIPALSADPATRAIALLGNTEGSEEEEFAAALQDAKMDKPVFAYIAGRSLPAPGAEGGIPQPDTRAAARKEAALAAAGANVYNSLGALVAALKAVA